MVLVSPAPLLVYLFDVIGEHLFDVEFVKNYIAPNQIHLHKYVLFLMNSRLI